MKRQNPIKRIAVMALRNSTAALWIFISSNFGSLLIVVFLPKAT
jgi:hypothetical protein